MPKFFFVACLLASLPLAGASAALADGSASLYTAACVSKDGPCLDFRLDPGGSMSLVSLQGEMKSFTFSRKEYEALYLLLLKACTLWETGAQAGSWELGRAPGEGCEAEVGLDVEQGGRARVALRLSGDSGQGNRFTAGLAMEETLRIVDFTGPAKVEKRLMELKLESESAKRFE